ncbi:hypothetical protein XI03_31280 [Bradyrhizobium sp. CCBAU 65884]|uniref:hypothetical protein n=1 Tax=Bradyrhizobium sp. CCBAU 65884 TaxID=722477 RepID=UPI002306A689|nr:hypothetical protein [Bradyrhizobium sp. CCBAU 65884]MDA9478893.1 hypothetical protein [Bradyrhizobium sp. CCBAU 65884]
MATDLLSGTLTSLVNYAATTGGLGTAAYGLVDVSKAFWGGISNAGFGHIKRALGPYEAALRDTGTTSPMEVLRANWLNGAPLSQQKANAKSLIRLGLSPKNAFGMAEATGIDPDALRTAANKVDAGAALDPQDVGILARFDAIVDAVLDGAYERADQKYRNSSKGLSALIAIILAGVGGGVSHAQAGAFQWLDYLTSQDFLVALLVGAIASPLAPVAKDLSSYLAASARPD